MGYSYDRTAVAKELDLVQWNLDGLTRGETVTLYHGTSRTFKTFDMSKARQELVNKFYGAGIFLTPSKRVAEKYAQGNRNIGFDSSLIEDLKHRNPGAGKFMEELVRRGDDAWEDMTPDKLGVQPEEFATTLTRMMGGVDPNTIADVARFVLGSKLRSTMENEPIHIFNQSTGLPEYMYANLDEIGLDSEIYRPKVYKVDVRVSNPLVTKSKTQAKNARAKGYDCVVFYGNDLVDNIPEVAVFNPGDAKIKGYEVI